MSLLNLLGFGKLSLVDDSGDVQMVQATEVAVGSGFADRIVDRVRRVMDFGFSSVPPLGADLVMMRRSGDRSRSVAIGSNDRASRPRNLQPGDSVQYDVRGAQILLSASGITINAAGLEVLVTNASKVHCECDIETTGDIRCRVNGTAVSLGELHDAYNAHHHTGVTAGSALSGTTDTPA